MGRRKKQQENLFLPTARGGGHRFYEALNKLLSESDFDEKVEELCGAHYAAPDKPGRPSIPPGLFFRMMLVGYFEGICSERGIAWRCADSISLRDFLGLASHLAVPDSSTLSRTRRRLPEDLFEKVFRLVLGIVEAKGLLKGRVRGVDSTYLKADASMRTIVRNDSGEDYRSYIKRVAAEAQAEESGHEEPPSPPAAGSASSKSTSCGDVHGDAPVDSEGAHEGVPGSEPIGAPDAAPAAAVARTDENHLHAGPVRPVTMEEAVRHDRRRKKTTSNKDWRSRSDSDARIVRMKDGTTRLGYKPEHVVDMETGVVLAAQVHLGDQHDAATIMATLAAAAANIEAVRPQSTLVDEAAGEPWHRQPTVEVVADKGYHKVSTLLDMKKEGYRTFIPERKQRGQRKFTDKGGVEASRAFHENRARTRRAKGKELQRRRGELLERPNQHLYDRGGLRRLTLTSRKNVQKRIWLEAAAYNLGAILRRNLGAGAPKWLAAAFAAVCAAIWALFHDLRRTTALWPQFQWARSW